MTVSLALNTRYAHLDDDRLRNRKPNTASREREAVVRVTLTAETPDTTTGQISLDFSSIAQFSEVYYCKVVQASSTVSAYAYSFFPGSSSATGALEVRNLSDGALNTSTAMTGTLDVEIRGI